MCEEQEQGPADISPPPCEEIRVRSSCANLSDLICVTILVGEKTPVFKEFRLIDLIDRQD